MRKKPQTLKEIEFFPPQKVQSFGEQLENMKHIAKPGELPENWSVIKEPSFRAYGDDGKNEFMRTMLPKGGYDIDYVINLLGIIIDNCGPLSSILSIKESCKKLQGYLKVEKCPSHQDPRIRITCPNCKEHVVLPRSIAPHWKCPCNKNTNLID